MHQSLILNIYLDNTTVVLGIKLTPTGVDESGRKESFQQCCQVCGFPMELGYFLLLQVVFLAYRLKQTPNLRNVILGTFL